jgi:hypothetical protein
VPERDDVRFHLLIREVEIPSDGSNTPDADFPSLEAAKGLTAMHIDNEFYISDGALLIKNVSFENHKKWTDAPPTARPRPYTVTFPAKKDKRYLLRLLAKRFTFDNDVELFSQANHLFAVDTPQ